MRGNKDNGGVLVVDGEPFWLQKTKRPTKEELGEATDDELAMNADVILEVHKGNVKLVNMPNIEWVTVARAFASGFDWTSMRRSRG